MSSWNPGSRRVLRILLTWMLFSGCGDPNGQETGTVRDVPQNPSVSKAVPEAERARLRRFWTTYREGLAAKDEGRWDEASRFFTKALELDPSHQASLHFLGSTFFEQDRYEEAEQVWRRLVDLYPRGAPGNFQLGALYSCPEPGAPWNLGAAAWHFEKVVELNPEQTGPFTRMAEIALARGELDEAAIIFNKVTQTNSMDATAFYLLGYIRWRQGKSEQAARLLGQAATAIRGTSPIRGVLGEGDSTAKLRTTFPRKRLFATFWLDLESKGYGPEPAPEQVETEYGPLRAYHEGILARSDSSETLLHTRTELPAPGTRKSTSPSETPGPTDGGDALPR